MPHPDVPAAGHSGLRDNHSRGRAGDFLRERIAPGTTLSFVSAYFTIHAYDALRAELESAGGLRFLFGEPSFLRSIARDGGESRRFGLRDHGLTLENQLAQKRLAKDCAAWIRRMVEIRSIVRAGFLHGKMYHIRDGKVASALVGSSNFTVPGLGLQSSGGNIELNLVVSDDRDRIDLLNWFDALWNDAGLTCDVREQVLTELARLYSNRSPEFVYYLTLFHLFRKYLDGVADLDLALSRTSLPDTGIWNALFSFQKDGAKAAINTILANNGCILADSVGLGKTYTALAVIRFFELRNERVLVLCPKKLRRNWTVYRSNSSLNPFDKDRFRYDVLSHTDLSRDSGEVGDLDLATIHWGAYDLVVIDESHNFRNNKTPPVRPGEEPKQSRYQKLMAEVIRAGARTKVLLLSATPVNNQLADLRNQISFIAGGDVTRDPEADAAFSQTVGIGSVKDTTRTAQRHFTTWSKKKPGERNTRDLLQTIGGDFFKLLDGLSIARSRRQIATYYKDEMKRLGGFPKRPAPIAIHPPIDLKDGFLSFEQLDREIGELHLALYHPTSFLRDDLPAEILALYENKILGSFDQKGRERILISMMKVNFLKRLESSVDSFRLTLHRTIGKIASLEERISRFEAHAGNHPDIDWDSLSPDEIEDPDAETRDFTIGGRRRIHLAHLKREEWLKAVRQDRVQLQYLLEKTEKVTPERDAKLADLRARIQEKVSNPSVNTDGKPIRKVLVFTAFADTAKYLYDNLLPRVGEYNEGERKCKCGRGGPPLTSQPARTDLFSQTTEIEEGRAAPPTLPPTLFTPYSPESATCRTRQHLPHWKQSDRTYFLTWRLADSIAASVLRQWKEELDDWRRRHPEPWNDEAQAEYYAFFERKDAWLDAGHGSCILARDDVRAIVEENLRHFDGDRYVLDEFVIMPNHVHVIVKPLEGHDLPEILHSWKSFTGKEIAKLTGRQPPVWMDESFDHIVRTFDQLERFRKYIRENAEAPGVHWKSGRGGSPLTSQPARKSESGRGGPPLTSQPEPSPAGPFSRTDEFEEGRAAPPTVLPLPTPPLHIALVVGDGDNRTTLGDADFDDILTNFSPVSKRRAEQARFPQDEEIDILIATDCISEGQNLQDCDLLINYDIHWNPVRIIQRFGRIDRIGSRNASVQLVNFWPVADLDQYLNVKHRVEARMALADLAATQTDNLLDPQQLEDLIDQDLRFRNQQLKRLRNEVLDLEDFSDSPGLTDFSLDEFRIDLLRFLESRREELESAPPGLYAVVPPRPDVFPAARPGTLFCLRRTADTADPTAASENLNPLAPHFLVYVLDDGTVRFSFAQPKEILTLLRGLAAGHSTAFEKLCDLFDDRTRDGSDMSHYDTLAQNALRSIENTFRKRAASSLLSGRGGLLPSTEETPKADAGDWELVTWLVVMDPS